MPVRKVPRYTVQQRRQRFVRRGLTNLSFRVTEFGGIINDAYRLLDIDGDALGATDVVVAHGVSAFVITNDLSSSKKGQSFIAQKTKVTTSTVTVSKAGSPSDNIVIALWSDSSGTPGSELEAYSIPGSQVIVGTQPSTSTWDFTFIFNTTLTVGTKYWIVYYRSGSTDGTNFYRVGGRSSSTGGFTWDGATWTDSGSGYSLTNIYTDSSYGLWRASTNLITNGGFESNTTGWSSYAGGGTVPTLTRDTSNNKFGSACMRIDTAGANPTETALIDVPASASTQYTLSFWIKAPVGHNLQIGFEFYDGANTYLGEADSAVVASTGNWQRLTATGTTAAGTTHIHAIAAIEDVAASVRTFYVDGVQFEQQPYATPYIETNGATAARSSAYVTAPTRLLNGTQGWAAFRFRPYDLVTSLSSRFLLELISGGDSIRGYYYYNSGNYTFEIDYNKTPSTDSITTAITASSPITAIFKWTSSDVSISLNGGAFVSHARTHGDLGALSTLFLGTDQGGANVDGEILWSAAGTGTLSDSDAATIHGFGDVGSAINYPIGSTPTFYWPADTDAFVVPTEAAPSGATSDSYQYIGAGYYPAAA